MVLKYLYAGIAVLIISLIIGAFIIGYRLGRNDRLKQETAIIQEMTAETFLGDLPPIQSNSGDPLLDYFLWVETNSQGGL